VDLSGLGFNPLTDNGINRTQTGGIPDDTDTRADWVVIPEMKGVLLASAAAVVVPVVLTVRWRGRRKA